MATEGLGPIMAPAVALLGASVLAIPLFRRLGLGSVLGYFAAGVAVGPFGFAMFSDPEAILHVAELGVVLFLFIIGLELRPARLWAMRRQIFGVGLAQVLICIGLLTAMGMGFGYPLVVAFVGSAGFVLSSTAVIMSVMQEQGEIATPEGQKSVAILLFEDLLIVPLLALIAVLAPVQTEAGGDLWTGIAIGIGAIAFLLAVGRWLMDPMFSLLARARSREAMSAGALLVVLGAALLMERAGLSTAMGAFLAGVMLSGSTYRHQIEADIEPFRGILMGLFFLSVGMSLDLGIVARYWLFAISLVIAAMMVKALGVYGVARITGSTSRVAIRRMVLFAQGGEFAFVLYGAAHGAAILNDETESLFAAVVILSMALTPLLLLALNRLMPAEGEDFDGVEGAEDLHGRALLIGFGRFGQMASQGLLARGVEVSIIDTDTEMIRAAESLGFKVYYGDGARLDILHTSGAAEAEMILICVDDADVANHIVELAQSEFPQARLFVRAIDRRHSIHLRAEGVDYEIRETVDSALSMARQTLIEIGTDEAEADDIIADLRARDRRRMAIQLSEGMTGGRDLLHRNIADSFAPSGQNSK
ncbi:MAG: monovalent cation:proton antiporter-2 (CPA2) family protein [Paracoccus sp. (in: a-proteobacteria)]